MKRLFNSYSVVFLALTVFLVLFRWLYVIGFDDAGTAILGLAAVFLIARFSGGEISVKSTGKKMTLAAFIVFLAITLAGQTIGSWVYKAMESGFNHFGITMYGEAPSIQQRQLYDIALLSTISALYGVLFGPITEELLYRSYAAKTFEREGGKKLAIIVSAAAFAIGHGRFSAGIHTLIAAFATGYIMLEYGFAWAAGFHVINNLGIVGLDILLSSLFGADASMIAMDALTVVLVVIAVLICRKHREEIKAYIQDNPAPKGEYGKAFLNVGFFAFLAFNIWKAVNALLPL